MKKAILFLILFINVCQIIQAQIPGNYPATTIVHAGGNVSVLPSAPPSGTTSLGVFTSADFKGLLIIDPVTGIVAVTNAHPAGVYNITVHASNGIITSNSNFILTVGDPLCSQGLLIGPQNINVGNLPFSLAFGDLNNDGKQDIATTNYSFNSVSILFGDGAGGFIGTAGIPVGTNPLSIAIGDVNQDGKQDLVVANFQSFNVSILLGNGLGGFVDTTNVNVGDYPYSVSLSDFNGDGKPDISTANYGTNNVSICLGNGLGAFNLPSNFTCGNGPRSIASGDFNGDGKPDLVTANYLSNNVSILIGDGLGGFGAASDHMVGIGPHSITIDDFNKDGIPDFATANINSGNVSIRLGNGFGSFTGTTEVSVGTNPRTVVTGDFNGDGNADLATSDYSSNTVSIRLGNGTGGFSGSNAIATGNSPFSLAIGDFNSDGKQDIVTSNGGSNDVSVLLGSSNIIQLQGNNIDIVDGDNLPDPADHTDFGNVSNNFNRIFSIKNTGPVKLTVNSISLTGMDASLFSISNISLPVGIAAGGNATFKVTFIPTSTGIKNATVHVSNDNCANADYDFVVQGTGVAVVSSLGNYPATTVAAAGSNITVTPDFAPTNAANITAYTSTGFKGLLQVDIVTGVLTITNAHPAGIYNITVKANGVSTAVSNFILTVNNNVCSQGHFGSGTNMPAGPGAQAAVIGDFNGDGNQDLAMAKSISNDVSIRLGNGIGGFTGAGHIPVGINPKALAISDLNADGKQDMAVVNSSSNDVSIRLGDGAGGFGGINNFLVGANPLSITIADFNADGKPDLATANYNSNDISILLGDGLGGFSSSTGFMAGNGPRSVVTGDFNNDGLTDLAAANDSSNNISVLLGNGMGGFSMNSFFPVGMNPFALAIGDFNGDGKQDIAATNFTDNTLSICTGDGTGNFSLTANTPVGIGPRAIAIGDFNGDGKDDIASTISGNNTASIRLGNGTGNFFGATGIAVGNDPFSLVIGDLNSDGRMDLVTANAGSSDISIRFGRSNEINVQGNNTDISDGDNTADPADHTDFGNVSSSFIRNFVIQNTGMVNLLVNQVNISGADSAMFTVGNISLPLILLPGANAAFTVAFVPTSAGIKNATLQIQSDHCEKALYDFALQGTGVLLVPVLGSYPPISMPASGNITVTANSPPVNTQNITAYTSSAVFKGILSVDAATGSVFITNAQPAGIYTVYVKAYGISTATSSFILTVNNTGCSQGAFALSPDVPVGNLPFHIAIGDFNNDGNQDLASANYSDNNVSVSLGDGLGNFANVGLVNVGVQPWSVAVGDFNSDGKQDLAIANNGSNNVSIRIGDGFGNFTGNTELPVGIFPTTIITGDFNNDGKVDIATALLGSNAVAIRLGDGTGNFAGTTNVTVGSGPFSIAISDFNNDGNQDIVSVDYNVNSVSINLGNGSGGFIGGTTTITNVGFNPYAITSGDFNGDGNQDIATANYNSNDVSIRLGDGTGNFSGITEVPVGVGPGSLATGDFNGDGKPDIVTANYLSNNISIRYGDGNGEFNDTLNNMVGIGPQSLAIGDFNGDAKQDIVIANRGNNNLSLRMGISNEISVQSNSIEIPDGDTIPQIADNTNFGITLNATRIFSIRNTGKESLVVSGINISGADAASFTISGISLAQSISPSMFLNFQVTFMPVSAGIKTATINIINNDCDESLYDFAVEGEFLCIPVAVTFTGLSAFYCANSTSALLTGNFTQGSVFTGAGITDNGNGTAIFDPVAAGAGTHVVQYVYTDPFGCTNSISQPVTVAALPVVGFSGLAANYFISDPAVTLTGNPLLNGIFTGPGITANGNGLAIFNPVMAGPGIHNITYTFTNLNGCSNSSTQQVNVNNAITINLKLFLQGYYIDGGIMQPVLNNQAVLNSLPNETDSVTIALHDPASFTLVDSKTAVLLTDGTVSANFMQPVGSYYIAIKHRNTIQTWSTDPVLCLPATTLYDFTTAANKAMGDNQAEVQTGVWALYTGDLNQDDFIDGNDFPAFDTDSFNGVNSVYVATDMNGDGFVDGNDFPVFDVNSFNGVSAVHP